jgi:hypothetical protein
MFFFTIAQLVDQSVGGYDIPYLLVLGYNTLPTARCFQVITFLQEESNKMIIGAGLNSPAPGKGYDASYAQSTPATEDAYARFSATHNYSYDAAAGLAPAAAVTPSLTGAKNRWDYAASSALASDGLYGKGTYSSTYAYEDKQYTSGAKAAYTPTHMVSEDFLRGETLGTNASAPLRKDWLAPGNTAAAIGDSSGVDLDCLDYYSLEGANGKSAAVSCTSQRPNLTVIRPLLQIPQPG